MKVREVMKTEVVTVSPQTTYEEAARILHERGFSGLPVVDSVGKLLGIISEKDLFRTLYPDYRELFVEFESNNYPDQEAQEARIAALRGEPIAKFMSANVLVIDADAPILKAGGLMLAHKIHRLPVVKSGKLVGIVTREDIYGAILKHHLGL